ncbi:MAG: bis(5'-nucleosyl)-tetraphosphatase (symmetrical) YqeK [Cetobacterium sp.]|uniref:bis(5'-nucleosyl)-tetraphosphatase (symmetrical) YqeK n=1 Tax=Cetobacterium sp. TaxID=2071632 RepID=UPI002FCADDE5
MDIDYLKNELSKVLSIKRYEHSIRVLETATNLASIYGADISKVQTAAILHDYAKEMNNTVVRDICNTFFKEETKDYMNVGEILHSFAGVYFAKEKFKIEDSEILNAIKYHTTGRKEMTLIEKIVYISDAIEPKRDYPHVEEIRKLALVNLDDAILFEANRKIEYLVKNGSIIHLNSVDMRNHLLMARAK